MSARWHRDLAVCSERGAYRFESRSPQNRLGDPEYQQFYQTGFVHTLVDTRDDRVLWSRAQAEGEGSPCSAWVSDDGFVVLRVGSAFEEALLVFDRTGKRTLCVFIGPGPSSVSLDRGRGRALWTDVNVAGSTAGLVWLGASLSGFASSERGPCFWIRAYWGRRLVIDLERGKLLRDAELDSARPACWRAEREWAEGTLAEGHWRRGAREGQARSDLLTALLIAAEQRLTSAGVVEAARAMEVDEGVTIFGDYARCALGRQWGWRARVGRVIARRVLRRLGGEPSADVVQFYCGKGDLVIRPYATGSHHTVLDLSHGTSAEDVLARIGAPDWITHEPHTGGRPWTQGREIWEYDGADDSTRIVWSPAVPKHFDIPQTLERVERIEPQWDAASRLGDLRFTGPATPRSSNRA